MKAEEHPLSQKPLIERISKGEWKPDEHYSPNQDEVRDITCNNHMIARVATHNWSGISKQEAEANHEAVLRIPSLLKAEQELEHRN